MTEETKTSDPSYGIISANRCNGQINLFGVDYPQQHFIEITIGKCDYTRKLSNDWYFAPFEGQLIKVRMSEVQWARLICSLNSEGVPCSLSMYYDKNGKQQRLEVPDMLEPKAETYKQEVKNTTIRATDALDESIKMLKSMLEGNTIKKADAKELLGRIQNCKMQLDSNLPFVLEQAGEAIENAVEKGKAEISAHVDFSMQKLGEKALGHMAGGDPSEVKKLGEFISQNWVNNLEHK